MVSSCDGKKLDTDWHKSYKKLSQSENSDASFVATCCHNLAKTKEPTHQLAEGMAPAVPPALQKLCP